MKNNQLWLLIGITFILTIMFSVLAVDVYSAETLAYNTSNYGSSSNSNVNTYGGTAGQVIQNFTAIGNALTAVGLNISNWTTTPMPAGTYVNIRVLYDANVTTPMLNTTNISSENMPLPLLDNSVTTAGGTYVKFDITNVALNVSQNYAILYTFLGSGSSKNVNVRQTTNDLFTGVTSSYAGIGASNYEILGAMYFDNTTPATPVQLTAKDYYDNATLYNLTANITSNNDSLPYQPFDNNSLWIQLDALDQTALDSSGNGNTGTLSGWTFTNQRTVNTTYGTGYFNQGLTLYNSSYSYTNGTTNTSGIVTLSLWINPNASTSTNKRIISLGENYYIRQSSTGVISIASIGLTDTFFATSYSLPIGIWNHITVTYNGTAMALYVNGTLNQSEAKTGTITSASNITIGSTSSLSGEYFNGTLDEVRLWTVPLTSAQILQEMNSAYPVNGAGLVASYSFETNFTNATGNYTYDTNNVVAGQINGSFNFDGKSNYVQASTSIFGNYTKKNITISSWILATGNSAGSEGGIVNLMNGENNPFFSLGSSSASNLGIRCSQGNNTAVTSTSTTNSSITYNEWNYFVCSLIDSGSTVTLNVYKNGVLVTSTTATWNENTTLQIDKIRIGAQKIGNNRYWNGSIDDVRIYNRSLSASEVLTLYNAGKYRQYSYSTTNGTIGSTQIYTNSTRLFNISVCSNDNTRYFCKSHTNYNVSTGSFASYLYPQYLTLALSAKDYYDNQSLSNISATFTPALQLGQSNSTTTGTLTVLLPLNVTHSIDLHASDNGGYFTRYNYSRTLNTTKTSYLNDTLWQSIASFSGTQKYTGASVGAVQVNVTNQSNTSTLYLKAGTYTASLGATGYFVEPYTFTTTALSSQAFAVENFSNAKLNVSTLSRLTGLAITTFNASIIALDYGDVYEQTSTTTGSVLFNLTNGTYNVTIDASGYAIDSVLIEVNGSAINYQKFNLYTTNSINMSIYDETTYQLINTTTAYIEFISEDASYNYTTTTGNKYVDLISPEQYTIRYRASGYVERFSYLEVSNRTTQNMTLYLLPAASATNITVTVLNERTDTVSAALVRVLKYNITSNEYSERQSGFTDEEGKYIFSATLNAEFYKFIIEYPVGEVVLISTPAYITSTSLILQFVRTTEQTSLDKYLDVTTSLEFNNGTNNFRADFTNSANVLDNVCMYVYRVDSGKTLYNSSCSDIGTQTGTIFAQVDNVSGRIYRADLYLNFSGTLYYARSKTQSFAQSDSMGSTGLLIVGIITLILVFVFKESIVLTLAVVPLPLVGASAASIIAVPVYISLGIAGLCWVSAYLVSRWTQ